MQGQFGRTVQHPIRPSLAVYRGRRQYHWWNFPDLPSFRNCSVLLDSTSYIHTSCPKLDYTRHLLTIVVVVVASSLLVTTTTSSSSGGGGGGGGSSSSGCDTSSSSSSNSSSNNSFPGVPRPLTNVRRKFRHLRQFWRRRKGVVDKVARLRAGRSGVRISTEASHFSLLQRVQTGSEAHPIQWVPGALSSGVTRLGPESSH